MYVMYNLTFVVLSGNSVQVLSKLLADVQVSVLFLRFFLSEFVYLHTIVRNMGEVETLKPFRVPMEIVALYT